MPRDDNIIKDRVWDAMEIPKPYYKPSPTFNYKYPVELNTVPRAVQYNDKGRKAAKLNNFLTAIDYYSKAIVKAPLW